MNEGDFTGLLDMNERSILIGSKITNGKAIFEVVWDYYSVYLKGQDRGDKFMHELDRIIREKYWIID